MKPKVYLETSIISYLAARISRNILVAANQQVTQEWWETRRRRFDLFISQAVIEEVSGGDPEAAVRRLQYLQGIPLLELDERSLRLTKRLVASGAIPLKATQDAVHIAVAAKHAMDFLLTWNFKHIANAAAHAAIEKACRAENCEPPIICTPQGLLEA